MVAVREARPADSETLWAVRRAAVRDIRSGYYTDEQLAAWARRGDMPDFPYDDPGQYVVAGLHEGRIVGLGGADLAEGEVRSLYVQPDCSAAVGSTLLDHLESVLAAEGYGRIALDASLNSVPFYRRFGYSRTDFVRHENHGVTLEFIRMRKALNG